MKNPRGVSYGSGGIGFRPNLYNKALLPTTPFIYYDQKLVTRETWPDNTMKIVGVEIDPDSVGIVYDYRKMPLLSSQFRHNAILQADAPLTIFGSAVVWYVASPTLDKKTPPFTVENSGQPVRVMTRMSKRTSSPEPARFSVSTSYDPYNRFASVWNETTNDFASALGHRLAKQSGRPTGIIHMTSDDVALNSWIAFGDLKNAPSLMADYRNLAQMQPGNEVYDTNVRRYISDWKKYDGVLDAIPALAK